jgi:hypothetical protein
MASNDLNMSTCWGYDVRSAACRAISEIYNPYNSGWETEPIKRDLYYMILWLQEEYGKLPDFVTDEAMKKEVEQQFLLDKLSKK